jgi:hypothetical protein
MIFSQLRRHDDAPMTQRETNYEFLNRSSRPEIARVRCLIENSLAYYPLHEFDELVARIRSGDRQAFQSATFELLLHDALRRLGNVMVPHPELPNGLLTRPDFLVTDSDRNSFYLEAVNASTRNGRNIAAEALKSTTIEALARMPHHSFLVEVDSDGDPTTQPRSGDLIRRTHTWLNTLDPSAITRLIAARGFDNIQSFTWSHEDWTVTLRPIPLLEERRGASQSLVGIYGIEGGIVDDWTPIRDALKRKGRHYGELTLPLVVAVNSAAFNLDPIDELQALFGQEQFIVGPNVPARATRVPNGAWVGPGGTQGKRVSGAWIFNDLTPYTVASRRNTMYLHPQPLQPLPESLLRFPHARVIDGRINRTEGLALRDIFDLTVNWPE